MRYEKFIRHHRSKRQARELSGEIGEVEKRQARLQADLAALRLFDPSARPTMIKPRVKRKSPTRFWAGEMTRSLLGILRKAEGP